MAGTKRKPTKGVDPKQFAKAKLSGASTQMAMQAAGYSESVSRRGWASVNTRCKEEYAKQLNITLAELEQTGGRLTPEQRAKIVRGKALQNIAEGKDESVGSMKILGQDREVNMYAPDSVAGIVIIECPKAGIPPLPEETRRQFGIPSIANQFLSDGSAGAWDPKQPEYVPPASPEPVLAEENK